ncbi:MAG: hypothetical protein J7K53_11325 [Bacteroidales bacterium]|nr:hypothetical protein [Bacteroidales bacterium]
MKNSEKIYEEILSWFNSGQKIPLGLKIHAKYSKNYSNIKLLAFKPINRKKLLPIFLKELLDAHKPANVTVFITKEAKPDKKLVYKQSIQERLQKEFPKIIFKKLPESLKLLVFERYDAWEQSKIQYQAQHNAETDNERFIAAKLTEKAMQLNWQIWDELNYWHKHKTILGKHHKFKEDKFQTWLKEQERKSPEEYTKEFAKLRAKARNNLHDYNRKAEKQPLTDKQQAKYDLWIYKHDLISIKLKEPAWKV